MEKRVKGNYIAFSIPIVLRNISAENGVTEQRYVPTNEDKIIVRLIGYKIHTYVPTLSLGGEVVFADNGTLGEGVYGLEVLIEQADGKHLRSYVADVLNIVNETKDADTETENEEAVEIESTLLAYTDGNGSSTIISGLTEQEVRALVTTMLQDYARLTDIPTIPSIPEPYDDTNILNALANKVNKVAGKGLSTNDFTDTLKQTLESLANNAITSNDLAQAVSNAISALDDVYQPKGNYLTQHQSLEAYVLKSELANYVLASALAAVATSGSYNDLLDKPTIPSAYDDTAIKNRLNALEQIDHSQFLTQHQSLADYLTKALAEQTYQPKGNYLTEHQSLADYLTKVLAQETYQPKGNYLTAHQDISGKMDKEVIVSPNSGTATIEPNKFYTFGEKSAIDITLATPTDNTIANYYHFSFTATEGMTLAMPASVIWQNETEPPCTSGNVYEVSIIDNCASYMEFVPYDD